MPNYVVQKVNEALDTISKSIKDSHILVLGLAYKKNVDDTRESPSLAIIDILMKRGANVQYSDPYLPKELPTRKYNFNLKNIKLTSSSIKKFDLIVIAIDHDVFDYELIEKEANIIVDTRGKIKNTKKVVKA